MATQKIAYAADVQIGCAIASLTTSSTFIAGYESEVVDNTSNLYVDALLSGKVTVGTSPTANTFILVYVLAPINDTPTWPDVFDGSTGPETLSSVGVGQGFLKLAASILVDSTTSDRTYPFGPISVAALFGGTLPPKWEIFVTHNTVANLNATAGNHEFSYVGVHYTVA